jgi:hypothetical protein
VQAAGLRQDYDHHRPQTSKHRHPSAEAKRHP